MANGVAIPNAFIRCCIVGVTDDDVVTLPLPKRCCWICCTVISAGWSGDIASGVYALDGSIPLYK